MLDSSWLWVVFTVIAAAAQTVRNATQRELTAQAGPGGRPLGAFRFGFPFRPRLPARGDDRPGESAAAPAADVLALGDSRGAGAGRRHRADACGHERPLLRGGLCLYQDRAGAGGAVRPHLSR